MPDKRFEINGPETDTDLIISLYEIYKGNVQAADEGLAEANVEGTEVARKQYLKERNYLGINIRMAFISYIDEKGIYFDVEEAIRAVDAIHQDFARNRHSRLSVVTTGAKEVKEQVHG